MKKLTMLLALLLCMIIASTAMAASNVYVTVQDLPSLTTTSSVSFLKVMDKQNDSWWNSDPTTYDGRLRLGALALNQSFLSNEADAGDYNHREYCVFERNGADFPNGYNGYRVFVQYSDFGINPGDTIKVYYGNYNEQYDHPVNVEGYEHWEPVNCEVTVNGSDGFYVDINETEYNFPVLLAWKSEGNNGGNAGGNNQSPQLNNAAHTAAKVPQTGDPSALTLWSCLMVMAGAGMLMLRRRAHN